MPTCWRPLDWRICWASGDVDCSIRDESARFVVDSESDVTADAGAAHGPRRRLSVPADAKRKSVPASIPSGKVLNYEEEKERAMRAKNQAKGVGAEIQEEIESQKPVADWRLYQALNALQGDGGTNSVAEFLSTQKSEDWSAALQGCSTQEIGGEPSAGSGIRCGSRAVVQSAGRQGVCTIETRLHQPRRQDQGRLG